MSSKNKIVCVSGGYDPLHIGHLSQIEAASLLGDYLIVILNNDDFLLKKKGYVFLPSHERYAILKSIKYVDEVFICNPPDKDDMSVCSALQFIKPHIFAKGGDRHPSGDPILEEILCQQLGIEIVYGVGGYDKKNSSSILVENAFKQWSLINGKKK